MTTHLYGTPLKESWAWGLFRFSECLEDGGIQHCIAGGAVAAINKNSVSGICDLYLAVADKQVDDALAILLREGLEKHQGKAGYVDRQATMHPDGWPGYVLGFADPDSRGINVIIVPATFWHMNLSESSLKMNTFLYEGTRCRFPDRLYYLDILIDLMGDRGTKPGINRGIYRYFHVQFYQMLAALDYDTLRGLPVEDQWFIDLDRRPLPPSIRTLICVQRQRMRRGELSVEDAWKSIPKSAMRIGELERMAHGTKEPQRFLTQPPADALEHDLPDLPPLWDKWKD